MKLIIMPVLLLVVVVWLLFPSSVNATAQPDNLVIEDVQIFRHLLEADDMLMVFYYDIEYTSQPANPANQTFMIRLMNGGTTMGTVLPYPYGDNSGYQEGVRGMYFTAAEAPTWGGSYTAVIQGNPSVFFDAEDWKETQALTAANWSPYDTQDENQNWLRLKIINIANELEVDWDETLLVSGSIGEVLNTTGEGYFINAIVGLRQMCPELFAIQTEEATFPSATYTRSHDADLRNTLDGTAIGNLIAVIERNLNVPFIAAGSIIILLIYILVIVSTRKMGGGADDGMLVGLPVILAGVRFGLIPIAGYAIFALCSILLVGYIIWLAKS